MTLDGITVRGLLAEYDDVQEYDAVPVESFVLEFVTDDLPRMIVQNDVIGHPAGYNMRANRVKQSEGMSTKVWANRMLQETEE